MREKWDLRAMEAGSVIDTDVCIVGSGPAGVGVASELTNLSVRVVLLEGGGASYEKAAQEPYEFESIGHPFGRGELERRVRVLGGTSTVWTGRCAPFDPVDLRPRAWIPRSGWPISHRELMPYLKRGGAMLRLAPMHDEESMWARFGVPPPRPSLDPALLHLQFWQYSQTPDGRYVDVGRDVLPALLDHDNISIILHANVTRILTCVDGRTVRGVEARTLEGKGLTVRAPTVVLACGGLENARLLLASTDARPKGLGNDHDLVGRFLMDHPAPVIGTFAPEDARRVLARFGHYWLDDARGRHVFDAGLALSERVQMERRLPNTAAYLVAEPREDASVAALRRLVHLNVSHRNADARALLRDVLSVARGPAEILDAVARRSRHRPEIVPVHSLQLVASPEQFPNPNSRVTLSERRDPLGTPIVRVDWRIDERERDAALAMLEILRKELPRIGLPTPTVAPWVQDDEDWRANFVDAAHPMGTTRMAEDPRQGVVDPSCAVHGVDGLYIAGSSVFPTGGTANPTMMIVALAMRLGEHLRERVAVRGRSAAGAIRSNREARVRVGIVGDGPRLTTIYQPVLGALEDRFEIVGIATSHDGPIHGAPTFRSVDRMVEDAGPNFLIACLAPRSNPSITDALLDFGLPLLVEPPLAWSLRDGRTLLRRVRELAVPVGVAEPMPYLPVEELKAGLREAGVFGRILAAHNDRHTLNFHGIAQARRYLGRDRQPCEVSATHGACLLASRDGGSMETWQTASVRYDDGTMLHQQLGNGVLRRIPGSLRIHGECASMVGDELRLEGRAPVRVLRTEERRGSAPVLRKVSIELPELGEVDWENPYAHAPLDDEQIAIAAHLDAMRRVALGEGEPLYGAEDALCDVEILRAMRISAALSGAPVSLPVSVTLEGLRLASRPRVWLEQLRETRLLGRTRALRTVDAAVVVPVFAVR